MRACTCRLCMIAWGYVHMCSTAMSPFINLQSLCFTSDAAGHSWRPRRHVAPLHSSSAPLLHCSYSFLFLGYTICLHLTVFTSTVLFLSSSLLSLPSPPFSFPFISSAFRFPLIFSFSLISFPFLSCCFFSPSPLHSLPLISPLSLLPSPLLEQS